MKVIRKEEIYNENYGWLDTYHHFSFANYYDPNNMGFGEVRVINDDIVKGGTGFETHPHRDMEIITYPIHGKLTHGDSLQNRRTIGEGYIQYMSAGTGILHSEHNLEEEELRLLQIWVVPDKKGYEPAYGDYEYKLENRKNNFLKIVSGKSSNGLVKINQDVEILVGEFNKDTIYSLAENRKLYGILIEGEAKVNGEALESRDSFIEEKNLDIEVNKKAHFIFFVIKK